MPRKPYPVHRAQRLLEQWVALRVAKSSDDAPITAAAAVEFLKTQGILTHRTTLYSKGLNVILAEGAQKQLIGIGNTRESEERRGYEAIVDQLRDENRRLVDRNRALLGEIAVMVWNARRCNVSEDELRQAMPKVDRSRSRAGRRR